MKHSNPYNPTDAVSPSYFAGRRDVLSRAEEVYSASLNGSSGGILLTGHRGIGKTSALRAMESRLEKGTPIVRFRVSHEITVDDFVSELLGRCRASVGDWDPSFGITEIRLPIITVKKEPRNRNEDTPGVAMLRMLKSLRNAPVLWLSLDDIDLVQGDALSLLKSAMEETTGPTIVMAVAGGPYLRDRLISEHSPVIRFFSGSDFDLANFSIQETREALELPIRNVSPRVIWEEGAIEEVHKLTGGYPYLVQCLAYSTYREGTIKAEEVRASLNRGLKIAGTWMEREIPDASDKDIREFGKIADAGKSDWSSSEFGELGIEPIYVGRLVKLGVLRKKARGHYSLVKPPMIARYHLIRRGLIREKL